MKDHPCLSIDEVININFIEGFVIYEHNDLEVSLTTLIDDINCENIHKINIDGIQIHN